MISIIEQTSVESGPIFEMEFGKGPILVRYRFHGSMTGFILYPAPGPECIRHKHRTDGQVTLAGHLYTSTPLHLCISAPLY